MNISHLPRILHKLSEKAFYCLFALGLGLLVWNPGQAASPSKQEQPPETPRLVVKISGYGRDGMSFPVLSRVSERGWAILGMLPKNSSAPAANTEIELPGQVFLKFTAVHEGDAVRVRVVTLPVSPRHEDYVPGKDEKEIINKLVAEDAVFTLSELTALGLAPLELKVEPYKPLPQHDLPQVVNTLPALEVVTWEAVKRGPTILHRLKLRNLSDRNIVALRLTAQYPDKSGSSIDHVEALLIAAGGLYQTEVTLWAENPYLPSRAKEGDARKLLIKAILFDNGTYQGDTETAIDLIGARMGENAQKVRVLALLDKVLNAAPQPDETVLTELAQQSAALPLEPDAFLMDELAARFPDFKQSNARDFFGNALRSGLHGVRQVLIEYQLTDIKRARKQNPQQFNLRESLLKLKTELGQLNQ